MKTILLVDDDADARIIYGRALRRAGDRVLEAPTGSEALAVARSIHLDVVLLDIGLPDIDGLTVARALRRSPATAGARIIALSAYVSAVDRELALAAGCDAYLEKPILPRAVVAAVH
jgi:two-component system, cell cycle response regulator DivK